eukprot:scaffold4299_cov128-Isochrysis_galbana.AAC.4
MVRPVARGAEIAASNAYAYCVAHHRIKRAVRSPADAVRLLVESACGSQCPGTAAYMREPTAARSARKARIDHADFGAMFPSRRGIALPHGRECCVEVAVGDQSAEEHRTFAEHRSGAQHGAHRRAVLPRAAAVCAVPKQQLGRTRPRLGRRPHGRSPPPHQAQRRCPVRHPPKRATPPPPSRSAPHRGGAGRRRT